MDICWGSAHQAGGFQDKEYQEFYKISIIRLQRDWIYSTSSATFLALNIKIWLSDSSFNGETCVVTEEGMCHFPLYDVGSSNIGVVACNPVAIETTYTNSVALWLVGKTLFAEAFFER